MTNRLRSSPYPTSAISGIFEIQIWHRQSESSFLHQWTNESAFSRTQGYSNMADIDFYQDDSEDAQDDGGDNCGLDYDGCSPDDNLTPIQRLEKYMDSENIFNRQMVARGLLDTLRLVCDNQEDALTVLKAMTRLAEDPEPTVRAELMEQVPHLAVYCHDNRDLFTDPIPTYILPIIVKYLTDSHNQVRKTSQAALLVLLEQQLVYKGDVEEQVCPVILDLSSPDSIDDFRTEAVALMSKMAPLVGKDLTERVFLPRFAELCSDALFHVRKVCAANFGDMCSVVGQEKTEKHLLPKFYYLCEDGVWGVRKACAECFMAVSCCCGLEVRRSDLASLFISLICDQSRWVRMAAFQALGGFISTFADPSITGLYLNDDGLLVAGNPDELSAKLRESIENCDQSGEGSSESGQPRSGGQVSDETVPLSAEVSGSSADTLQEIQDHPGSTNSGTTSTTATTAGLHSEELVGVFDMELEELESDRTENPQMTKYGAISKGSSSSDTRSAEPSPDLSPEEIRANLYQEQHSSDAVREISSINDCDNEKACENKDQDMQVSPDSSSGGENDTKDGDKHGAFTNGVSDENATPVVVQCDAGDCFSDDKSSAEPAEQEQMNSGSDPIEHSESGNSSLSLELDQIMGESSSPAGANEAVSPSAVHIHLDNVAAFNSFQFWRSPLPSVDLDFDIIDGKPTGIHVTTKVKDEEHSKMYTTEIDVLVSEEGTNQESLESMLNKLETNISQEGQGLLCTEVSQASGSDVKIHTASVSTVTECESQEETVPYIGSTHVLGHHLNESTLTIINGVVQGGGGGADVSSNTSLSFSPEDTPNSSHEQLHIQDFNQDVIPQALLDHYLSMTDPSRAQTVDTEIAKHCAYSLPAVAYTLGRRHWPCLKELYETLAADMQWKVRRTLAFSIHELALIVGCEITNQDLVPVFSGFLKDLDEVRIGVLKHLADFLRLLYPDVRLDYLHKIADFLNTDNNRNWRFREELAEQLTLLIELYTAEHISEYLVPIALALAEDKVSEVRGTAYRVLAGMLRRLSNGKDETLVLVLINDVIERFALSKKWNRRQIFAQLCLYILEDVSVPPEQFAKELMPSLLAMGTDPIPNVRISLAKTLAQHVITSEYFTSPKNPHHKDLLKTIQTLQSDCDRDVRYFINKLPNIDTQTEDMVWEPLYISYMDHDNEQIYY